MKTLFGYLGRKAITFLNHISSIYRLSQKAAYWFFIAPFKKKFLKSNHLFIQMVEIGVGSVPIVFLISLFMGMVLAMQTAYQLQKMGALMYVGSLVAVSMTREIGPLLTAIVIAGRSGSAMAAELGTMKVSEEIDALETIGINPVKFLVVPRILAIVIMLPCLTILADWFGMLGGYIIGVGNLGISSGLYISKTIDALILKDIFTGLIKSVAFAGIIGMVGCYQGFIVKGGAEGVGKSTTTSVVLSTILIILADCIFTAIFYFVFP
ncbi:MAG: ABC transporter permease [Candidatus Omnitrophota bacterium]|nr:ABC transporter permease [Candidatus Omnitrophota bacterium]